jgi:hypothetical protein
MGLILDASRTVTSFVAAAAVIALILASSSVVAAANPAGMGVASPYAAVDARNHGVDFANLPGFTRSVYERDHALITPESRVYTGMFGWKHTNAAWLVTPAMAGAPQFSMYQVGARERHDGEGRAVTVYSPSFFQSTKRFGRNQKNTSSPHRMRSADTSCASASSPSFRAGSDEARGRERRARGGGVAIRLCHGRVGLALFTALFAAKHQSTTASIM